MYVGVLNETWLGLGLGLRGRPQTTYGSITFKLEIYLQDWRP